MFEQVDKHNDAILGYKKIYVLYEISSSLIVSLDTNKNFYSIMNILSSRLNTKKGSLITLDKSGKKKDELFFGFDEEDIKSRRYNINNDMIRNVAYTKDIVFLIQSETGIEAKGAQMTNFIEKGLVKYILVPVLNEHENVSAIFVVDKLFDDSDSLEKDIFFLRSIAAAISKSINLRNRIDSEKGALIRESERLKKELRSNYNIGNIISVNEKMAKVIEMVKQVAESTAPVMFTGEPGTGKELLAKALHYNSIRVSNAFSKIHCGALPDPLLSIELFGNEVDDPASSQLPGKRGKLEMSDGGTLYLEQIESMPLSTQGKLLKYLTDGVFETEGNERTVKTNTRVIVGSTQDLERMVEENRFLPELYYELSILHIELPSLKERREDIPLLVKYFIMKYSKENAKKAIKVTDEVLDKFMNYTWPGNVRELENCLKRMVIISSGKMLDDSLLPGSIKDIIENNKMRYAGGVETVIDGILKEKLEKIVSLFSMRSKRRKSVLYKRITDNIDKILIELSLQKCNNIQTDAAAFLGINRNTLRSKIEKLKIDTSKVKDKQSDKGKKRNLELPLK